MKHKCAHKSIKKINKKKCKKCIAFMKQKQEARKRNTEDKNT